ncbi:unnamed protein product, partial [Arabidopsis halleri]
GKEITWLDKGHTMISPDGEYVLSGSSDGNAYIWQV